MNLNGPDLTDLDTKKSKNLPSKVTSPPSASKVSFFSISQSGSQMEIASLRLRCKKKDRIMVMSKYIFMFHSFHLFHCLDFYQVIKLVKER